MSRFKITAQFKLVGDKRLQSVLKSCNPSFARKVMRAGIRAGLQPIVAQARLDAPERTGLLRAAIKAQVNKRGASGKVFVDPSMNMEYEGRPYQPAKIAHILEFGSRKAAAQPFMRPALALRRPEAIALINAKVRSALAKEGFRG